MAKASDNAFPSVLFAEQATDVATPPAGHWRLQIKAGGLYAINAAGTILGPFAVAGTDDQTAAEVPITDAGAYFTGTDVEAALQELGAGGGGGGGATSSVRVYKDTTAQSVASAANSAVSFNAEAFDADGFHDNATNNTRLTVPAGLAGRYRAEGQIQYQANTTNERRAMLYLNGALIALQSLAATGVGTSRVQVTSGVIDLAAGDYVELYAHQNSTVSLNVEAGAAATWFSLEKLA